MMRKLDSPFRLDRLFYINQSEQDDKCDKSDAMRGCHANRYIREIMVCVDGSCDINMYDGKDWHKYILNKNNCIYIGEYIWIEYGMFRDNCSLLVLVEDLEKCEGIPDKIYDFNDFNKCK